MFTLDEKFDLLSDNGMPYSMTEEICIPMKAVVGMAVSIGALMLINL